MVSVKIPDWGAGSGAPSPYCGYVDYSGFSCWLGAKGAEASVMSMGRWAFQGLPCAPLRLPDEHAAAAGTRRIGGVHLLGVERPRLHILEEIWYFFWININIMATRLSN